MAANVVRVYQDAKQIVSGQVTADPNGREQTKYSQSQTWCVEFDAVETDWRNVVVVPGLPVAGRVYNGLFCSRTYPRINATSPRTWNVQVDFENIQLPTIPNNGQVFNLSIAKGTAQRQEEQTRDRTGGALVNTVGDLLPHVPKRVIFEPTYTITWSSMLAPNPSYDLFEDKANSDACSFDICGVSRSFAKRVLKCTSATWTTNKIITSTDGDTPQRKFIYDFSMTFQVRFPKWYWTAPNEGWQGYNDFDEFGLFMNPANARPTDPGAMPMTAPTKIDIDGYALPKGSQPLKLPDDVWGKTTTGRSYPQDGAFELEDQVPFSPLFNTFHD